MKKYLFLALAGLCSCQAASVRIDGRFAGVEREKIYLERVTPQTNVTVDSVATDAKGNFRFCLRLDDGQAALYNLRYEDQFIPLMLSQGQRVKVKSLLNISRNYTVEGSEESALIRELNTILRDGALRLDSLSNQFTEKCVTPQRRREIGRRYADEYYRIKREQLNFIVSNSTRLAAIYALYQRLPNDRVLFFGDSDIIYMRLVADSVSRYYPDSPYLAALKKEIAGIESRVAIQARIADSMKHARPFPDLAMPDMFGNVHRLSAFSGKVVLIDFWSAATQACAIANEELKGLYKRYAQQGFEVYQVSLDESKYVWAKAVQEQQLPWISVCDFQGRRSPAATYYNIQKLPSNYLLGRDGEIIARDLYGKQLEETVQRLLATAHT